MTKKQAVLLVFLTLFSLWFIMPAFSITIPKLNKQITLKPKNLSLPFFGKNIGINNKYRLGLDLQGGSNLLFSLNTSRLANKDVSDAVIAARNIIEKRINFFGVSEPQILLLKKGEDYKVSVDIPGSKKPEQAIKLIGQTAQLDFREYKTKEVKQGTESAMVSYFVPTLLGGKYLKKASLVFDQQSGQPQVSLLFDKQGTRLFAELTKKNTQKPLAIFLDESLVTAPIVQQEIKNGQAVISGNFTIEEAKQLISALNAGALPVPIKLVGQKTVEATLGKENVQKSMFAGLIGLVCVVLFMLGTYKKEGIIASVSLILYGIFSLALYKLIGVVLTLSGIAGFVLSIGMAVDSNILIYERIKEEKTRLSNEQRAVKTGFFRALSAIKSANINTLIVCFILFNPFNFSFLPQFGSVRGFALTLAIGVAVGLFTGVFITKNILWGVYKIKQ